MRRALWFMMAAMVLTLAGAPLGLAYLRCAERGELPEAGVALLAALHSGDGSRASAAALDLRTWGASSGTAMLWGIAAGAGYAPL